MTKRHGNFLEALISRRPMASELRRLDFKGDRRRFTLRLPRKTLTVP